MEDQEYRNKIRNILITASVYDEARDWAGWDSAVEKITRLSASHFATPQMEVDLGRVFTEQDVLFMIEMLLQRPDLLMDAVQNDQTDYDNQALFEVAYLDLMDSADSPRNTKARLKRGNVDLGELFLSNTNEVKILNGHGDFKKVMDYDTFIRTVQPLLSASTQIGNELSDERMDEMAEKYAFRVPYDGSNNFYDKVALKHYRAGLEHYRSERNRLNKVITTTQE